MSKPMSFEEWLESMPHLQNLPYGGHVKSIARAAWDAAMAQNAPTEWRVVSEYKCGGLWQSEVIEVIDKRRGEHYAALLVNQGRSNVRIQSRGGWRDA